MAIDVDFSYELDGFEFGRGTNYYISEVDFGYADLTTHDSQLAEQDGISFGRDFRGGRLIGFAGTILTTRSNPGDPIAAPNAHDAIAAAWEREDIRHEPGMVIPLRMHRNGRQRRVFGRPRRFVALTGATSRGRIPFSCDFMSVSPLFFSDDEHMVSVTMIPDEPSGLVGDWIGDLISSGTSYGSNQIVVGGTKSSWLKFKIYGPSSTGVFSNPDIEIVGQFRVKLDATIAYDDSVTIDPHPWSRSVRQTLNDANLSGKFTANSPRLSQILVPPGTHQVILRGVDPTNTARVEVFWRDTYGSF